MKHFGRGVFFHRIIVLAVAISTIVTFTSFCIRDVFAYEDSSQTDTSESNPTGFIFSRDIPYGLDLDATFHPKHVSVTFVTEPSEGIVYGTTVRDVLNELGIPYQSGRYDIKPDLDYVISADTHIRISSVSIERATENKTIPYSSMTILDDTRELDTTAVVQTGHNGEKKVVYELTYINGILSGKKVAREEILSTVQNEIIALGTMRVFRELSFGTDTFSYWKKMTVYATTYDSSCPGCSTRTALGVTLTKGVCAVDPTVIPLKTRFYVPGYGFCQALDVGGAIKGNKIDLGFEDLRKVQGQWSAHNVEIYILD